MNPGERVRILSGPGAGHEGVVVNKNGNHYKIRTQDFGGGLQARVIVKGRQELEPVKVYSDFQGRPWKAWVPPKVVLRAGSMDFMQCPSVFADGPK